MAVYLALGLFAYVALVLLVARCAGFNGPDVPPPVDRRHV